MTRISWLGVLVLSLAVRTWADDDKYGYVGEPAIEDTVVVVTGQNVVKPGAKLRLASYNMEHFEDGLRDGKDMTRDDAIRHAKMASSLVQEFDPDILIVEELENAEALRMLNDDLKTPYPAGYVTNLGTGQKRREKLNIGVLSRLALEDVKEVDFGPLTGPGRPTRGLLRITINLGDGSKLLVYGVHLKSNYGQAGRNVAQREHALEILRKDADAVMAADSKTKWEVVVAGDFNVDPDLPEFSHDHSLDPVTNWTDLWRGMPMQERVTVPTRHGNPNEEFPPATFDRFIVSPALTSEPWKAARPVSLQQGTDTTNVYTTPGHGSHVSDHFPVYLDIAK